MERNGFLTFVKVLSPGCNHKHSPSEHHGAHRGNVSVVVIMCKACHEEPLACLICHLTAANVMMTIAFTGKKTSYQKWFQNFPWGLLSSEEKLLRALAPGLSVFLVFVFIYIFWVLSTST